MLKMEFFRLGTINGDKRLGMIIIFQKTNEIEKKKVDLIKIRTVRPYR
jgi:hypothetical protein